MRCFSCEKYISENTTTYTVTIHENHSEGVRVTPVVTATVCYDCGCRFLGDLKGANPNKINFPISVKED